MATKVIGVTFNSDIQDDELNKLFDAMDQLVNKHDCLFRILGSNDGNVVLNGFSAEQHAMFEVYLPYASYTDVYQFIDNIVTDPQLELINAAWLAHPNWDKLDYVSRMVEANKASMVLGAASVDPVDLLLCWSNNGECIGRIQTAVTVADTHLIPVYNVGSTSIPISSI